MLENTTQSKSILKTQELSKNFVSNVFSMMFVALGITAVTAYWFANSGLVYELTGITHWIVMLAPLGLVLLMGTRFTKLSAGVLMSIFILFSVLMGMSLSYIFLAYDIGTISSTFFITAGTFGTMAVLGYTTSTDLTKFGSLLYMALIGIIIASVVNWFMGSEQLDYIISIAGVLIFTGLTAYDVQKIKRIGASTEIEGETKQKLVIMGALTLYLDFINLFLFILRIFGRD
jgi:FtsH-binding integral membrane protein